MTIQIKDHNEHRYKALIENMLDGFAYHKIVFDENGNPIDYVFLEINDAFEKLTGLRKESILGKRMTEVFADSPDGREDWIDLYGQVVVTGKSIRFEKFFPPLGRWYSVSAYSNEGGYFSTVFHDITDNKANEEKLRRERDVIAKLMETSPAGITVVNPEGKIIFANARAEHILGLPRSQIISRQYNAPDWNNMDVNGHLLEDEKLIFRQVLESGKPIYDYRQMIERPDGKKVVLSINGAPLLNSEGTISGVVFAINDITQVMEAEEEIRYLSFHDKLTGLYNRGFFEEELERLDTSRQLPLSLILGDANGLKLVNDAFGHEAGDKLLKRVAQMFREVCRQEDIIARIGGDEFAVILPRVGEDELTEIVARMKERCRQAAADPIKVSIALGAATKEHDDQNVKAVFKLAEDRMYQNKLFESKSTRSSILASLKQSLEERSHETEEHGQRMKLLALKLGRSIGLNENQLIQLDFLALLHDIGKIAIPDSILEKEGALTEDEWKIMKTHSEIGYRIAGASQDLAPIADSILHHHEHWDGSGYPQGLQGEEIPLLARIISIVDAYDSMTHGRPFAKSISKEEALAELRKESGKQFDPIIVEAFIQMLTHSKRTSVQQEIASAKEEK
ncbi:PAS domain S-box-containing protein/diguanylate cyclase (GGDEF) domain-containing protein [Geosporobacter subterraneus DSM 17957]|uniref:PAS domain S-box-containing protein/diguanylate cyclase (GGDEF) domain-containing protein n=1 Tax=Geosporobacter subterraneus DSM 17957 TaxID=1121919 RepID=A0A1M6Q7E7_9FIRM|nr:HD domain-containing phosphohydrolase [Geosporobacter subterraneus]SHK16055.1 PAS domain S-box-containing protein/diguanylate cyclase (GGDEF) domain-containing protein [Geosporobacter subterraneus DSM 17957]